MELYTWWVEGSHHKIRKVKILVTQSCVWLFETTMDCVLPRSSIHGILQARILKWVAIPFSRGSSWLRVKLRSPALQVDSLPPKPPGQPSSYYNWLQNPTFFNQKKGTSSSILVEEMGKLIQVFPCILQRDI